MYDRDSNGRFTKENRNQLGKKHSIESRIKMSNSLKGHVSWNKGLTKSTDSRISGGRKHEGNHLSSCGYMKRWIKGKQISVHHIIWKQKHLMPIPKGCCIHHVNLDKTDNKIENLILLSHDFHAKLHWVIEKSLGITRNWRGD